MKHNLAFSLGLHIHSLKLFPFTQILSSIHFIFSCKNYLHLSLSCPPSTEPARALLQMVLLGKEKPVLVAVYVEKPRRRSLLPSSNQRNHRNHHHHHHLHHHLYVHRAKQHGSRGRGYNRRADLLEYSRNLRESARSSAASTPLLQHSSPESHSNQQSQKQIFPVKNKPKIVNLQTCLGEWKLLIPRFFRSANISAKNKEKKRRKRMDFQTTGTKIKTIIKSFQVNKNKGFMSKVFASLKKHR